MKFRVHLFDGTKFETDETPDKVAAKYAGRVAKIKRIKATPKSS